MFIFSTHTKYIELLCFLAVLESAKLQIHNLQTKMKYVKMTKEGNIEMTYGWKLMLDIVQRQSLPKYSVSI